MIDSIKIERFRCFNETELSGFRRLNLFGGKNNAGKTSLLEGIYLGLRGETKELMEMRSGRDMDASTYLHHKGQIDTPFSFYIHKTDADFYKLEFKSSNHIPLLNGELEQSPPSLLKQNRISFILANHGQFPKKYDLSYQYSEAHRRGEGDEIKTSIRIVDPSIDDLFTYNDRNDIFLRKMGEKHTLPLSYFGDALQKMMRYAITAATLHSENGSKEIKKYLLIDEIENGLHYTVHDEFWEMLFKLAIAYDIQIFAATHSREMIEAFNRIAQKDVFKGEAAYFELFKHVKTGEISGHIIEADVLDYKLKNNKSLRGE
jgi:AAA15 family ATPase/GTPase